jgi:hypothetical protein
MRRWGSRVTTTAAAVLVVRVHVPPVNAVLYLVMSVRPAELSVVVRVALLLFLTIVVVIAQSLLELRQQLLFHIPPAMLILAAATRALNE